MDDPVTGRFKITEYDNKHATTTTNLVETMCLTGYPWPTEITHYQGSKFIGKEFRK